MEAFLAPITDEFVRFVMYGLGEDNEFDTPLHGILMADRLYRNYTREIEELCRFWLELCVKFDWIFFLNCMFCK